MRQKIGPQRSMTGPEEGCSMPVDDEKMKIVVSDDDIMCTGMSSTAGRLGDDSVQWSCAPSSCEARLGEIAAEQETHGILAKEGNRFYGKRFGESGVKTATCQVQPGENKGERTIDLSEQGQNLDRIPEPCGAVRSKTDSAQNYV